VEPPRGIEPRTCSLRGGRTPPTTTSTRDNSCRSHTFGGNNGTGGPEFAPRLIPRRALVPLGDRAGRSSHQRLGQLHGQLGFKRVSRSPKDSSVGIKPPASNRSTAGWSSRHADRSILLGSCWTRSCRTHFPGAVVPVARWPDRSLASPQVNRASHPACTGRRWRPDQYPRNVDRTRTLTAAVSKDGSWFVARCLEIEVASQGETIDDALANLREALELYFEDGDITAEVVHPLVTPIEIRIPA
jgi:predicted RNase H-like HicB family nuclease